MTQYVLQTYGHEQGLPHDQITDLAQTPDGYLWIAGLGGLIRFDGSRFKALRMENSPLLQSDTISALAVDRAGQLWVGTHGSGLMVFHRGQLRRHPLSTKIAQREVSALFCDAQGAIWVGINGAKVYRIQDPSILSYDLPKISGAKVKHFINKDGTLYLAYAMGGIFRLEKGMFADITQQLGLEGRDINTMVTEPSGDLWIGTERHGLFHIQGQGGVAEKEPVPCERDKIRSLFRDSHGQLWLGSDDGLYRQAGKHQWEALKPTHGLSDGRITTIFQDKEGILWLGTYNGGLTRLEAGSCRSFGRPEGLPTDEVRGIFQDQQGRLWVSSYKDGLFVQENGLFRNTFQELKWEIKRSWTTAQSADGTLYAGTYYGVARYDGRDWTLLEAKDGWPSSEIRALFVDSKDRLWIGSSQDGIYVKDGREFSHFGEGNGLPSNQIYAFLQEQQTSRIWVCTGEGVCTIENGGVVPVPQLPNHWYLSAIQDEDGSLWFGTFGQGIWRFANGSTQNFNTRHNLFDNSAFSLKIDGRNRLWASSDRGIFFVNKKAMLSGQDMVPGLDYDHFSVREGMRTNECNGGFPGVLLDKEQTLWYPTMRGLVAINLEQLDRPKSPPKMILESIIADGRTYSPEGELKLEAGTHEIHFNYTACSFLRPNHLNFRYKLEGFDPAWIPAAERRTAFYTNLDPGSYRFLAQVRAPDGSWSEILTSPRIVIQPFIVQRWWFKFLLISALLFLIQAAYRWRLAKVSKRNEYFRQLLEGQVAARTLELETKNLELETLHRIIKVINSEVDFTNVVRTLLIQATKLFPQMRVAIYLNYDYGENAYFAIDAVGLKSNTWREARFSVDELKNDFLPNAKQFDQKIFVADEIPLRGSKVLGLAPDWAYISMGVHMRERMAGYLVLINPSGNASISAAALESFSRFRDHATSALIRALVLQDLVQAQREAVTTAHKAGMAEVVTNVLHNIGNSLNSVQTSAACLVQAMDRQKRAILFFNKLNQLLTNPEKPLYQALISAANGPKSLEALNRLSKEMESCHDELKRETKLLEDQLQGTLAILRDQRRHSQISLLLEVIDLNHLLTDFVRQKSYLLDYNQVRIVRQFQPIPFVEIDRNKFQYIFFHVFKNALEACHQKDGGEIILVTGEQEEQVTLEVIDNGIGIPQENLDKVFRQGFTTKTANSGMGLHYCINAIREMKGNMQVSSKGLHLGTTVSISFRTIFTQPLGEPPAN